jgi:aminoglycoside/choline kinase family phosphotransferase
MKIAKPNQDRELKKACAREVLFYSHIAGLMPPSCIPKCHFAGHEPESDEFSIVLEDLSETHFQSEYPVPLSMNWCRKAVRCLAKIHAAGWDRGELAPILGGFGTKESVEDWSERSRRAWREFSPFLGDRLSDSRRRTIETVMECIHEVLGRTLRTAQQTVLHRDTHLWNFLYPVEEKGDVKLFDWQFCEYGLAADDLVPMIALNWFRERRARFENMMLREYHAALTGAGVTGYGLGALETEYRWSVLKGIVTPIMQWHHKIPAGIWFNNLEKILLAIEDLNCMELLQ